MEFLSNGAVLLVLFLVLLATGIPIVFAAGAIGLIFAFADLGASGLMILQYSVWNTMNGFVLIAIPFFIFMGAVLEHAGIAEDLYESMAEWLGNIRGGLAIGTVFVCTIFAAMSGVIGASIVTMSMVALPVMMEKKYSKNLVMGTIMGSGSLAMLIPPSILFILYGVVAGESIGKLYLGGVVPGIILALCYVLYIFVRCLINPELAPAQKISVPFSRKILGLKKIAGPMMLIIVVLGSMFGGIATASEAASLGACGALILAAIKRKLSIKLLKKSCYVTARATAMVAWIVITAGFISQIFTLSGGMDTIGDFISKSNFSPWTVLIIMQIVIFLAGCLLDDVAIITLLAPLFVSIIKSVTDFDLLWFGVVFNINLQLSLLTPPFGFALFYMRGVAPDGVDMRDIYRSAVPFIIIQVIVLVLSIIMPSLCTWLPNLISM